MPNRLLNISHTMCSNWLIFMIVGGRLFIPCNILVFTEMCLILRMIIHQPGRLLA